MSNSFATPWTIAHQTPLSRISQVRILEWVAISFTRGFFTTEPPEKPTVEYYLAIERSKIMPFTKTWMDVEIVIFSEVSQTQKVKYRISLTCGI